jgi:hypothetical protein
MPTFDIGTPGNQRRLIEWTFFWFFMMTQLSHQELSLLLFALEGAEPAPVASSAAEPSCEDACPVVDHLEEMFGTLTPEKKLISHLNNHLREGMLECGYLEVMDKITDQSQEMSAEDQVKLQQLNEKLQHWSCEIKFDDSEKELLNKAFGQFPRTAWIAMPRTLWRLRKKLRRR